MVVGVVKFRRWRKWISATVALVLCAHFLMQIYHSKTESHPDRVTSAEGDTAKCFDYQKEMHSVESNSISIWDTLMKPKGKYQQYKSDLNNIFDRPLPVEPKLEKVKVILIPMAHVDPGWLKTFSDYSSTTNQILDNVVDFLSVEPTMTFMWSESVFLDAWLQQATIERKEKLKRILNTKQLEISNGAWVMTDEASPHYWASIDNLIEGHQFLKKQLGVQPNVSWSCDPFGHSQTVPYLYGKADIKRISINRVHKVTKIHLAMSKGFDFVWRQMWDQSGVNDVTTAVLRTTTYDFKESCGSNVPTCCKFDFTGAAGSCSVGSVTIANVESLADRLQTSYRNLATTARFNVVFIPLGGDFHYSKPDSLKQQFDNYKPLMQHINANPQWNMEVVFGSLTEYFNELEKNSNGHMPTFSGDFFPYTLNGNTIWSGYFSSRPFYKLMDRKLHAALRSADILWSFSRKKASSDVQEKVTQRLLEAHRTLALFQHHDAITGTSKSLVMQDYGKLLYKALKQATVVMESSVQLLSNSPNERVVHLSENQTDPKSLPQREVISLVEGTSLKLLIHNPLPYLQHRLIRLLIETPNVELLDEQLNPVKVQINPVYSAIRQPSNSAINELVFVAKLPPLGIVSYTLKMSKSTNSHVVSVSGKGKLLKQISTSFPVKETQKKITLSNGHIQTSHNSDTGLIEAVRMNEELQSVPISFRNYERHNNPGAYMLNPAGDSTAWPLTDATFLCFNGPIMSECWTQLGLLLHKTTLIAAKGSEKEIHFENELDLSKSTGSYEVVMTVGTDVATGEFYTDSMGFQNILRKYRPQLSIADNYYPIATNVFVESESTRITVLAGQPHGVTVKEGTVEILLDRKTNTDDGAGLDETLNDNFPVSSRFILLVEHKNPQSSVKSTPMALLSHSATISLQKLIYQPLVLTSSSQSDLKSHFVHFTPLQRSFPCDVQLINIRPLTAYQPESLLILHRIGTDCNIIPSDACSDGSDLTAVIKDLLTAIEVASAKETSLSGLYDRDRVYSDGKSLKDINVPVMNIETFKLFH